MSVIVLPHTPVSGQVVPSVGQLANFTTIRDAFNNTAVQTDVAKTIGVAHTWAADILFTDGLYDIGKSGATRPRDLFLSRNLTVGGTITGTLATAAQPNVTSLGTIAALVAGTGTFSSTLGVTGNATFSSTITGSGKLTVSHATAENNAAELSNTSATGYGLYVFGGGTGARYCFNVRSAADNTDRLIVTGTGGTLTGAWTTTGAATFSSTVAVTGITTLSGNATVGGTLGVAGAASFTSTVTAAQFLQAAAGSVEAIKIRNTAGASGYVGMVLGSDTNEIASTIRQFTSGHATKPNVLQIGTEISSAVIIQSNGVEAARFNSGAVAVTGTFSTTGAVTLSSTLAVAGTSLFSDNARLVNNKSLLGTTTGGSSKRLIGLLSDDYIALGDSGSILGVDIYAGHATDRAMRIMAAGQVLIGTTVTTGAAAGDLVLANAKSIRYANNAGNSTIRAIEKGASDRIEVDPGGSGLVLGGAGGTLGFFAVAGATKQTGVAVTAAGIHAALVAYGLIS